MVYMARPVDPVDVPISPEIKQRHDESRKKYPHLNISEGEYILDAVKRHWIGLVRIWLTALAVVSAFMGLFALLFAQNQGSIDAGVGLSGNLVTTLGMGLVGLVVVLATLGAVVATYVYNNNRFYLTNESVIQEIQTSLFSRHEQTVSLNNIEDASFEQNGILPHIFNYGRIRLSTEGDETTYRFTYVAGPKKHIARLNNAIEAFKNGRPVDPNDN